MAYLAFSSCLSRLKKQFLHLVLFQNCGSKVEHGELNTFFGLFVTKTERETEHPAVENASQAKKSRL
jgi:hypothetical protein